jgi:hypothetical protein
LSGEHSTPDPELEYNTGQNYCRVDDFIGIVRAKLAKGEE